MAIFKKNGKYWIGYRNSDGRRRREPVGTDYQLAQDVLKKRQGEVTEHKFFPTRQNSRVKFADLAAQYWTLHGKNTRSNDAWKYMLGVVLKRFGGMIAAQITPAQIQAFYNERTAETSASTANKYLTLIKVIFNKAKRWGKFHGDNPCCMVNKQREANHRLRYLARHEIVNLLEAAKAIDTQSDIYQQKVLEARGKRKVRIGTKLLRNYKLLPIISIAIMTGMRRGEILGLKWENIDLNSGFIYLLDTKSGKPREIPLIPSLITVFMQLGPKPVGKVFDITEVQLKFSFKKALMMCGVEQFRFHDLRHTYASHFIMRDGSLADLQKILGHSSMNLTLRYAHLSRQHMTNTAQRMEGLINDENTMLTLRRENETSVETC
ncbi:Site-specific recombinase XerD [Parelusimicrobium proximum]|uniref:tyrosine-type recombinase/integrase n=1 Tax=Parelusimicrobium proximum TaxID=3228953 RepID=UPI003D183A09